MLTPEKFLQIFVIILSVALVAKLFDHWVSTQRTQRTGGSSYPSRGGGWGGMGRPQRERRQRWPNIYW